MNEHVLEVRPRWATADKADRYVSTFATENEAEAHLEANGKKEETVNVIEGWAVYDTETDDVHPDADSFQYTLDDAELEMGLLLDNQLGDPADEFGDVIPERLAEDDGTDQ